MCVCVCIYIYICIYTHIYVHYAKCNTGACENSTRFVQASTEQSSSGNHYLPLIWGSNNSSSQGSSSPEECFLSERPVLPHAKRSCLSL